MALTGFLETFLWNFPNGQSWKIKTLWHDVASIRTFASSCSLHIVPKLPTIIYDYNFLKFQFMHVSIGALKMAFVMFSSRLKLSLVTTFHVEKILINAKSWTKRCQVFNSGLSNFRIMTTRNEEKLSAELCFEPKSFPVTMWCDRQICHLASIS